MTWDLSYSRMAKIFDLRRNPFRHPPFPQIFILRSLRVSRFLVLLLSLAFAAKAFPRLLPVGRSCRLSGLTRRDHDGRQGWAFFLFSGADFGINGCGRGGRAGRRPPGKARTGPWPAE